MKVAVIAFGTRGDVQPLVVLAAGVASRSAWCSEVVFLTHQLHAGFVESLLLKLCAADGGAGPMKTKPQLATVDSPPVLWKGAPGSVAAEVRGNLAQEDGCMEACHRAGLVIFNMFALEGFHVSEAYNIPCVVCHPYLTTATPMPSSFPARMRRTYPHLYRRLTLTRLPDEPWRTAPPNEKGQGGSVTGAETASGSGGNTAVARGGRAETAWTHVEHWMWPLFTNRWGNFRERLGLHPCPLEEDRAMGPLERGAGEEGSCSSVPGNGVRGEVKSVDPARLPLVLYLFSPLLVDVSPFWPSSVRVCGYLFPTPTPTSAPAPAPAAAAPAPAPPPAPAPAPAAAVQSESVLEPAPSLAGRQRQNSAHPFQDQDQQHRFHSNLNLDRASEQPECDAGIDRDGKSRACAENGRASGLPPRLEAFLSARQDRDRPIYVGFGSMWSMCSPGYGLAYAVRALLLGARQAGSRCMVHLPEREAPHVGKSALEAAEIGDGSRLTELHSAVGWILGEFSASAAQDDLLVFQGPLAHDVLLPRCSVAIHHGGSGTTAAVLRAGIPQVICPQQLDQFFWAERVRHLSVGCVLERSLFAFVERDTPPTEPPRPLVCQAAAAILSARTPQTKLRAACLGVKIRAEKGLENALDSLSLFVFAENRKRKRLPPAPRAAQPQAEPPPQSQSAVSDTVPAQSSTASATSAVVHPSTDSAEGFSESGLGATHGGGMGMSPRGGGGNGRDGDDGGVRVAQDEEQLVLREMPNGLAVWWSSHAEEEAFFVFGEVFEDRTYARMGLCVQDGDTLWDVGANVGLASIFLELETDTPDSAHLYAFEPLPLNVAALKRNLSMHCPTAVIQEYALGATNQDGVPATFYPRMPGNSTLKPLEKERLQGGMQGGVKTGGSVRGSFFDDAEQVTCDVRTVSWAMAKLGVGRIDLLKIDVEGSELDVLLGIDEQDWPKIRQVVAEVHPVGDRLPRACELLRDHGFHVSTQALGLDGTPVSPSRDVKAGVDAAVVACDGEGKPDLSPTGAAMGTKSHKGANHFSDATEETDDAPQDRRPRRGGVSRSSSGSTNGDTREVGGGGCILTDMALDGVVFMVYAKRIF
eukprot:g13488.t1